MNEIVIDGDNLKIEDVIAVAFSNAEVVIDKKIKEKISKSRIFVEDTVKRNIVRYGITTGFGPMCNRLISPEDAVALQKNLIRSHSSGAGKVWPVEIIRAAMLLRANNFCKGKSGVRYSTLEKLIEFINKQVHPIIFNIGSVGASGDLIPLSNLALGLMGEGECIYKGQRIPTKSAIEVEKIAPIEFSYKEGLAMINGTSVMTAIAAITIKKTEQLITMAEIAAAMNMEAMKCSIEAFDSRLHEMKPHKGQIESARHLFSILEKSKLVKSMDTLMKEMSEERSKNDHTFTSSKSLQDEYSIRCTPQVMGAIRDATEYARKVVEIEMNSVTDNPTIFAEDNLVIHGGNFHGQPIGFAMDFLKIALAELSVISERRIAKILDEKTNHNLPAFLIRGTTGLKSGFMGMQYVPSSLIAENRVLATPASIQSVSTNACNQDIVSMGTVSAKQAYQMLYNTQLVVATEFMCGAQAMDILGIENFSEVAKKAYKIIRLKVQSIIEDRPQYDDIENLRKMIDEGLLLIQFKTLS